MDDKAHRSSEVDQTITQPLTVTQRKLDSLDRQKATTGVFGLLSLQTIQRTVEQLLEMNPEEIKDALTLLNGLIDITQQALKPVVLSSVQQAKIQRLNLRKSATNQILNEAIKEKLRSTIISSPSLFEEEDISKVMKSLDHNKQRNISLAFDSKRKAQNETDVETRKYVEFHNQPPQDNQSFRSSRGQTPYRRAPRRGKLVYFRDRFPNQSTHSGNWWKNRSNRSGATANRGSTPF